MIKIDFTNITVYTDIAKTKAVVKDLKEEVANDLYMHGQGIAFHALALKIYNSQGEVELDDKEYQLLMNYANQMCTPMIIDAFKNFANDETNKE